MKKFLIVVAALILLPVVAAGIFLATFDADRYKGLIAENFKKTLGQNISIGHIGLAWRGGVAFELSNLAVYADEAGKSAPGIQLENATAQIKFLPLLKKDIQITSVALTKPVVVIDRLPDGRVIIGGIDFSKSSSAGTGTQSPSAGSGSQPIIFSAETIKIRGGRVLLRDRMAPDPKNIEIRDLDLNVKNFSLVNAFDFDAAASIFSAKQNLNISGKAHLGQGSAAGSLDNFSAKTDIEELDLKALSEVFPAVKQLEFKEKPQGALAVEIAHLDLSPQALGAAKGRVTLKNGKVALKAMESPIDQIDLAATLGNNEASVEHLTARVAGGTVQLSGSASAMNVQPVLKMQGAAKDIALDQFLKNINPQAPQLNGHLSLDFEGQAQGMAWESISHTLNGKARVQMNDGVLLNYNILKEIISKISKIPGAESAFQSNFPQIYQKRMEEKSTLLKPVTLDAVINNGVFIFNALRIDTDYALISGAGQVGLDRRLDVRANLIINQEISGAAAKAFNPVQLLFNNGGEIVVPLAMQGDLPQIKILPDTQYITSKLLSGKAQELVQGIVSDPAGGVGKIEDILKKNLKGLNI